MNSASTIITAIALLAAVVAPSGSVLADGKRIAFVGCPVMRDMDLPERPCWLARDGNKLYFLGLQGDIFPPVIFFPPQLKHQVLVEAELTEGEMICGGLPLKNVEVSMLPELDVSCNTILPKGGFSAPPEPRPSPPFRPNTIMASDPATWPKPRERPVRPRPEAPFEAKTFRVSFKFGNDFLPLGDGFAIGAARSYFADINGSKIVVDVHRDRVELTNGEVIEESIHIAERRAYVAVTNLTEWGIPENKIETRLSQQPMPGGRFLTLTVFP